MNGYWVKLFHNDYELDVRFAETEEEANTVAIEMLSDMDDFRAGDRIEVLEGWSEQ